jgi:hypothetical protein
VSAEENRPEATADGIEAVLGTGGMALHHFESGSLSVLDRCTQADRSSLTARYLITWLAANGLITVSPPAAFEQLFALDLPEPYAGEMATRVQEAVERRARFDRMAAEMSGSPAPGTSRDEVVAYVTNLLEIRTTPHVDTDSGRLARTIVTAVMLALGNDLPASAGVGAKP